MKAKLILSSELICVRYQAICNELGISWAERAVMSKSWLQGRKDPRGLQLRKKAWRGGLGEGGRGSGGAEEA